MENIITYLLFFVVIVFGGLIIYLINIKTKQAVSIQPEPPGHAITPFIKGVPPKEDGPVTASAIVTKQQQETSITTMYNREQIDILKSQICPGLTDPELKQFLYVCKRTGLDPFTRQIYAVKRWNSTAGKEIMTIQTGIDGFRAMADNSNNYAGNDEPIFKGETIQSYKNKKYTVPAEASVTVYKIVNGVRCAFTATARWHEYFPGEKQGFMWISKPHIMLGKCGEALALRKTFTRLSGLYITEEMQQAGDGKKQAQLLPESMPETHTDKPQHREKPSAAQEVQEKVNKEAEDAGLNFDHKPKKPWQSPKPVEEPIEVPPSNSKPEPEPEPSLPFDEPLASDNQVKLITIMVDKNQIDKAVFTKKVKEKWGVNALKELKKSAVNDILRWITDYKSGSSKSVPQAQQPKEPSPEDPTPQIPKASQKQISYIYAQADRKGYERSSFKIMLGKLWKVESLKLLPKADVNDVLEWIDAGCPIPEGVE